MDCLLQAAYHNKQIKRKYFIQIYNDILIICTSVNNAKLSWTQHFISKDLIDWTDVLKTTLQTITISFHRNVQHKVLRTDTHHVLLNLTVRYGNTDGQFFCKHNTQAIYSYSQSLLWSYNNTHLLFLFFNVLVAFVCMMCWICPGFSCIQVGTQIIHPWVKLKCVPVS